MDSPFSNGSILGHYPSNPGTQSTFFASCQINSKVGDADSEPYSVAASFTFHDFSNAIWHNGSVRQVTVTADPAGEDVTVGDCRGINVGGFPDDYVNSVVTGTNVPIRTHIEAITGCTAATDTGTIQLNRTTTTVTGTLELENSRARAIGDGVTTVSDATLTSAALATFTADDVGCSVSGTTIPAGTTIASFTSATSVEMSAVADATGAAQVVTICGTEEVTTTRVTNSANFASSTSVTDSGAVSNRFAETDVGLEIFDADSTPGTGVTEPCVITAFVSATSVTVANRDTGAGCVASGAPATERTIIIGRPSPTAPADGDQLLHLGTQLDLDPTLVAGQDDCSNDSPEGFTIAGTYRNPAPDNFATGVFSDQPTGTKGVGQIVFDTSVIDFAAWVLEMRTSDPNDPLVTAPHYNYVWPNAPTTLAICGVGDPGGGTTSPGVGLTLSIDASTSSITSLPTGTGRPGTAQVRALRSSTSGYSTTAHASSQTGGITWSDGAGGEVDFTRICVIDPPPYETGFQCGP
jgi:hypothetical protein